MTKPGIAFRAAVGAGAILISFAVPVSAAPERSDFGFLQTGTVRVVTYSPTRLIDYGTGWVAVTADPAHNANNAIIVTALHVIRGADRIRVLEANSAEQLEASVRARDVNRDIAFLEVRGLRNGGVPLTVTGVVPPIGQELRTTGYAAASDRPSRNDVAGISGVLMGAYSRSVPNPLPIGSASVGVAQFQHSIPLARGFSGGPVIDKCGRVVGFNLGNGINDSPRGRDTEPGISFAVASTEIIKAAEEHGIRLSEDASPCPDQGAGGSSVANNPGGVIPHAETDTAQPSTPWWRGRTGLAAIVGLFALAALGLGAWLFFGKSGRGSGPAEDPRSRQATVEPATSRPAPAEPSKSRDSVKPGSPTTSMNPAKSARALTLSGRGPGGEPISLRFAADEMASQGRVMGTESEVHVPDNRTKTLVSRIHAEISWDGEHFFIKDLKSLNGTKVDGQALAPHEKRRLRDGASVTLADVTLNVQID